MNAAGSARYKGSQGQRSFHVNLLWTQMTFDPCLSSSHELLAAVFPLVVPRSVFFSGGCLAVAALQADSLLSRSNSSGAAAPLEGQPPSVCN